MAQQLADRKDVEFVLHEQLRVCDGWKQSGFLDFTRKTVDLILQEARNLALREILPTGKIGDQTGCRYERGKVITPPEFKRVWRLLSEGGWFAPSADVESGGQGMPQTLAVAAGEYLIGANLGLMMIAGLNHGVGRLIETFGNETQKHLYLKKVHSGEWGATMVLTEPDAGSDLGRLTTTAVENEDGTYRLSGNKIFISGGEQDLTENIIHAVLARIEGAPEGSRGISLFLVPKIRVRKDGTLGEGNDVVCTGIEEKMGLHGSPTCSLSLGGAGGCIGTLLGEVNKGLSAMFLMMNGARRMVALQALACASSAYLHALAYARTRIQGTAPGSRTKNSVPILQHPDVRRMLLTMKAYTEGMRSLLYHISFLEDQATASIDPKETKRLQVRIDILTPIAKSYITDRAFEICSLAVQIFGGYGYTSEYPVEQLLRDVRITSIYEGTNGIQAMDLLSRKLFLHNGQPFQELIMEIRNTAEVCQKFETLRHLSTAVKEACVHLAQAADHLVKTCQGPEISTAYAFASLFLEASGDVILSWMLLQRAELASRKRKSGVSEASVRFYEGQIRSAEFFIRVLLPVSRGKMNAVLNACDAAVRIGGESFAGL